MHLLCLPQVFSTDLEVIASVQIRLSYYLDVSKRKSEDAEIETGVTGCEASAHQGEVLRVWPEEYL
ncbi:hypothetical protein Clacol_008844 [Clathrus columnatus]|uniref:Uncharacterized protein n=1 Tax=Clathrus columnatus TaxID=1419009 RepID=A0AAV5APH2_9AGAM|nr:hypothetical protein Clacol_008844 [Clathrus columnatus]